MKKYIIILIFINLLTGKIIFSSENIAQKLSGKILLQVESHGEAWYVNTIDQKRYYLNKPTNAFNLMKNLGIGITNENLNKIPIGIIKKTDTLIKSLTIDNDNDGLTDNLENTLGTDPQNSDSDNDGYNDKLEIEYNYNPLGAGKLNIDQNFTKQNLGKIFLQTEKNGQAWYVNPTDKKRYYLGKPINAFAIMKNLSLGITNKNLNKITVGRSSSKIQTQPEICNNCQNNNSANQVFASAINAIKTENKTKIASYFIPEMKKAIEYTMDFLNNEDKLTLSNIMSKAKLSNSTDTEKRYSTEIYFSMVEHKIPINFYVKKQKNGTWKLTNL